MKLLAIIILNSFFLLECNSYAHEKSNVNNFIYSKEATVPYSNNIKENYFSGASLLPEAWQLQYFGYTGINPQTLAPNGNGLTLMQCYLEGINPQEKIPEDFSLTLAATGPFRFPANIVLVGNIMHSPNISISHIDFYLNNNFLDKIDNPENLYEFSPKNALPIGHHKVEAYAYDINGKMISAVTEFDIFPSNRFNRGVITADLDYISSIITLDNQQGDFLDLIPDFTTLYGSKFPWFLRAASEIQAPCTHVLDPKKFPSEDPRQPFLRCFVNFLPVLDGNITGGEPPMMAFGSASGHGTPLFINQDYHFGVLVGCPARKNTLKIEVFEKSAFENNATNVAPIMSKLYSIPSDLDVDELTLFEKQFYVQDYHLLTNYNGKLVDFDTKLQPLYGFSTLTWNGTSSRVPFLMTHRAGNDLFYYKVSAMGVALTNNGSGEAMAGQVDSQGILNPAYNVSYTLDFDTPAPWSTSILTTPQFQGIAIPSEYEGKSLDELIHHASPVADTLNIPNEAQVKELTTLNNNPEFKTHSYLDKLATTLGTDPFAIANYVQNNIELTDAIGYNTEHPGDNYSINSQGVARDALATCLERQGSPIEQCALLIYLLRKAGYPAAYVFPGHNQTLMFDQQLSKLLHCQIRGTTSSLGENSNLPELIPINYPWVVTFVNGKWIHLFPWIKDTEVKEGKDIWNYFPNGYKNPTQWVCRYLLSDPAIRSLSKEDNPGTLFPLYAEEQLKKENLTLEDVGIKFLNRPHDYTDWDQFPRPWKTPVISQDKVKSVLDLDFFDTIAIHVFSDRDHNGIAPLGAPSLETGEMRLADLHDRRLLLYHQIVPGTTPPQYQMILSLEGYDSNLESEDSKTIHTFTMGDNPDPGDFHSAQKISTILQTAATPTDLNDDALCYNISRTHHKQAINADLDYYSQFPSLGEMTSISDTRPLRKGDMAVLSLNYGRVTDEMKNFELKKYLDYQKKIHADPTIKVDPELATGQMLQVIGKTYYSYCSQFQSELEDLVKVHTVTYRAHGLTKFSPEYGPYGPLTTSNNGILDFNLYYPKVDMGFQKSVCMGNQTSHLESGANARKGSECMQLINAEDSAQEHRIINEFFNQANAVSTVKLLDIALASDSEHGITILRADNYKSEEFKFLGNHNITASQHNGLMSLWSEILKFFTANKNDPLATVIMTPQPVTASGQNGIPYTGMGAFSLSGSSSAAWITDKIYLANGGYGGCIKNPISSFNPQMDANVEFNNWVEKSKENFAWQQWNRSLNLSTSISNSTGGGTVSTPPPSITVPTISITSPSPTNIGTLPSGQNSIAPKQVDLATLKQEVSNRGFIGAPVYYGGLLHFVMDPVSTVSGEFYINALDLKLNGPMPLELRRIYGSQNQANNNFGYGWRLGYFPYLIVSADETESDPPSLIHAAETDGSVIAYRYNTDQKNWTPKPADNPDLINPNNGTSLSSKNLFNNRITKNGKNYILTGSNGDIRTFKIRSFPVVGEKDITRTRPYLESWRDPQGNGYNFNYGEDKNGSDYGELASITSNNGNNIHFNYNVYGQIVEAFSNDGQHLKYQYDKKGDLIQAILPDGSTIRYSYKNEDGTSTHLLTKEIKPDGRILENAYDDERRVVTQAATVGTSPVPALSATFIYNVTGTNADQTINGTTSIKDVKGNTTTYEFANSQITKTTYLASSTGVVPSISQEWLCDSNIRELKKQTDRRGLITSYNYDAQGNLTSRSLIGNITGSGGNETATTSFSYNDKNLLTQKTDSVGNSTTYTYGDSSHPCSPTSIVSSATGKTISSTQLGYQNFGLVSSMSLEGASSSYNYNEHGFLKSMTQKTGTYDPDITTEFSCNNRGEITSSTDSQGQKKKYNYDGFGRQTGVETYDASGALVDWHFNYYNYNGEIEWEQGVRFNPVDYIYYEYDRAGHLIHKTSWLSKAREDGSGVTSNGLATTTYTYDASGNMTGIVDPNGHGSELRYDDLGQVTDYIQGDGYASEAFTYEPGGKVATHSTVISGNESFSYTSTGLIQSASHVDGTTSSYRYNLAGRLVEEKLPNGTSVKTTYNGNIVTKNFSDASGNAMGSTSQTFDSRGNVIEKSDLAGNKWSMSYDGLGRIKTETSPNGKIITHVYRPGFESIVNALGEWTNKFYDALGRPILTTIFNRDGSVASNVTNQYSGDHQSVTTTVGTGGNAITTTTYSDLQGRPVITKHADGSFEMSGYDGVGNRISFVDEMKAETSYSYDTLNRLASETLPGGAVIKYNHNAAGELTSRIMPGGTTEQNSYNAAGQKVSDTLIGSDGSETRNHTYNYSGNHLNSISDPRGFTTSLNYDGWDQVVSVISSGSKTPEQNQTTIYSYDPRGLLTSVAQKYNDTSTGPSTEVVRGYDVEGLLTSEVTALNGTSIASWSQEWDEAGRRTGLHWNLNKEDTISQYNFRYNALGLITSAENGTGICSYIYSDNGLISGKSSPFGNFILARDNRGRIGEEAIQRKSDQATLIYEHMDWQPNNRLLNYKVLQSALGFPQETRNYSYDLRGRIFQEPFMMFCSLNEQAIPNSQQSSYYFFDENPFNNTTGGTQDGVGVRTMQYINPNEAHTVGEETSWKQVTQDNYFDITFGQKFKISSYDEIGNTINRSSSTGATDNFTWDSFGNLVAVYHRGDDQPYDWITTYDGLGRRIQTIFKTIQGGASILYYYDPEVEFLELGHSINDIPIWNLYGPDRSGTYGGAQGIGGLETTFSEGNNCTYDHAKNFFGDTIGIYTDNAAQAFTSVLNSYGGIPGSTPVDKTSLQVQWRGHYLDPTDLYYMGTRYYDPQSGRFLSADPLGHAASLSLYDYCGGDPVNGLDPDGRCVEGGVKGYAFGAFAEYDNMPQALGGFVGTIGSYLTPGLGEVALARDLAGSIWNGGQALDDIWDNGINWRNGAELGLSAFGMAAGGFAVAGKIGRVTEAVINQGVETIGSAGVGAIVTDFKTATDQAVFWSGRNGANFSAAVDFADTTSRLTLEMTPAGNALPSFSEATREIWESASRVFAEKASGIVNSFTTGSRSGSIWSNIEKPSLLLNPNVQKINIIDQFHPERTRIIYPNRP